MPWIEEIIKDAKPSYKKCDYVTNPLKKALAEKIREKGPGILQDTVDRLDTENVVKQAKKSITLESDLANTRDFDIDIEAFFDAL